MASWIIVTGEYPPKIGGVSAYTRNVAAGLAGAGDRVDVWAPARDGELAQDPGVETHALPDHFGMRSLALLDREIAARPDAHLLVQYVPHVFGMRAMNVPFAAWLGTRRRPVWLMFHEVAMPISGDAPWRYNVIGVVTTAMAAMIARRAERVFVSTPAWNPRLRSLAPSLPEPRWIPIPSNLPLSVAAGERDAARARLGLPPSDVVIGTFGTYGRGVTELLIPALTRLLDADSRRIGLLMGRGSTELAERAFGPAGARRARILATGELDAGPLAANLSACTATLQPYPDGITTRRTSATASLALGVPVVTNTGALTEPFWRESGAVALASEPSVEAIVRAAEGVLGDPASRASLARRAREVYEQRFSLESTVRMLREDAES